jgi:hypothetical protein
MTSTDNYANEESILVVPIDNIKEWIENKTPEWRNSYFNFKNCHSVFKFAEEINHIENTIKDLEYLYQQCHGYRRYKQNGHEYVWDIGYHYFEIDAKSYHISSYREAAFGTQDIYSIPNWMKIIKKSYDGNLIDRTNPIKLYFYIITLRDFNKKIYKYCFKILRKIKKETEGKIKEIINDLTINYSDYTPIENEGEKYHIMKAEADFKIYFSRDDPQPYMDFMEREYKKLKYSKQKLGGDRQYVLKLAQKYCEWYQIQLSGPLSE